MMAGERDATPTAEPIVWLHDRGENGVVSYRIGRRDGSLVAEWPGIAQATCAADGTGVRVTPSQGASPEAVAKLRGVLRVFVGELQGGLGVHAAAVGLGSRGVLLLGKSGAGKSTAAASLCLRHGGRLLADDAALLRERAGVIELAPSEGAHYLSREAGQALGIWSEHGGPPGTWKESVPAPACATDSCPVALVVSLELDAGSSAVVCRRLTGASAVLRMLGSMFRFNPSDAAARRRELDRVMRLYEQATFVEARRSRAHPDVVPAVLQVLEGGRCDG